MPRADATAYTAIDPAAAPFPHTYAFRTREGGGGLLQIVGSASEGDGVRVRYQLVVTSTGTAVGSVTPDRR